MPLYRDEAIVLRTHKLGEADRIVTLLTRREGRVRAVAKGVRRTSSRWGARLEPFSHVDVQLHTGRSLDIVTQAESIRPYGAELAGEYPLWTAGQAMLETAERLTPEEREPATQQFLLLVGGLRTLVGGGARPRPRPRLLPAPVAVRRRLGAVVRRPARDAAPRPAPLRSTCRWAAPCAPTAV